MKTHSALTLSALTLMALPTFALTSCSDTTPPKGESAPPLGKIPSGPGNWVRVAEEIPLETIVGKRIVLPYGSKGLVSNTDKAQVVSYSIAVTADPFAANDRCAMTVVALIQTSGDGSTKEVPATGTVVDNSDSQPGFRIDFSRLNPKQLVIPAGATAAVIFAAPVTLAPGMDIIGAQ